MRPVLSSHFRICVLRSITVMEGAAIFTKAMPMLSEHQVQKKLQVAPAVAIHFWVAFIHGSVGI